MLKVELYQLMGIVNGSIIGSGVTYSVTPHEPVYRHALSLCQGNALAPTRTP